MWPPAVRFTDFEPLGWRGRLQDIRGDQVGLRRPACFYSLEGPPPNNLRKGRKPARLVRVPRSAHYALGYSPARRSPMLKRRASERVEPSPAA